MDLYLLKLAYNTHLPILLQVATDKCKMLLQITNAFLISLSLSFSLSLSSSTYSILTCDWYDVVDPICSIFLSLTITQEETLLQYVQ